MNSPSFQAYYQNIGSIVKSKLDNEDSDYLLGVDFEEYLNYLVKEATWEVLLWDESQMTVQPFSKKIERRDEFHRDQTYKVEVQLLRLRIPISHHSQRSDYFKFRSSIFGRSEPDWKFEGDVIIHEVETDEKAVEKGIDDVRHWLGNRNKEIEEGNKNLVNIIRKVWEEKRHRLEETQNSTKELLGKINIPLHQDPDAQVKPIEIKPRQIRTVIEKPKARSKTEPELNRADVISLVDFIEQYALQFEIAPKTYQKMYEEELRDLLVGMMNANYPGSTTGETFNKLGKTDISLRVNSGNVMVCECKFWSGAKAYSNALEQLFDYLTWRQNFGILINFCKLKNMTTAITEGTGSIDKHTSYIAGTLQKKSTTRFLSRHIHPQDTNKSVEIHHLFIDLSV